MKKRRRRRKKSSQGAGAVAEQHGGGPHGSPAAAALEPLKLPAVAPSVAEIRSRFQKFQYGAQEDAAEFLEWLLESLSVEMAELIGVMPLRERFQTIAQHLGVPLEDVMALEQLQQVDAGGWMEVSGGSKKQKQEVRGTDFGLSTPLTRLFGGRIRLQARKRGMANSVNLQPFFALHLDILRPKTGGGMVPVQSVEEAVEFHMAQQSVEGFRSDSAAREIVQLTQQTALERLPPYLILHMKRFRASLHAGVGAGGGFVEKLQNTVKFQPTLVLPRAYLFGHRADVHYQLIGVVVHHGESTRHGHYTSFVRRARPIAVSPEAKAQRRPDSEEDMDDQKLEASHESADARQNQVPTESVTWWHVDDEHVHRTSQTQVLKQQAYILMYRQLPLVV